MAKRRDKQVKKVYGWEREWFHWNNQMISLHGARMWVRWACAKYKVDPPIVRAIPAKSVTSFYHPNEHSINLKPVHTNAAVALHEAAHAIQDAYYDWDSIEDHGPEFAGIYLQLLVDCGMYPRAAILESAKAAGINWSRRVTPRVMRRRKKARE